MRTVYIAVSLTHVKTEEEKCQMRAFLAWIEEAFDVELLRWAFDTEKWLPLPVDNIYDYDTERVKEADLMIALYLSNDGSDGRGGEVVNRLEVARKPVLALVKKGVRVSRYSTDCLEKHRMPIVEFEKLVDAEPAIRDALSRIPIHAS